MIIIKIKKPHLPKISFIGKFVSLCLFFDILYALLTVFGNHDYIFFDYSVILFVNIVWLIIGLWATGKIKFEWME